MIFRCSNCERECVSHSTPGRCPACFTRELLLPITPDQASEVSRSWDRLLGQDEATLRRTVEGWLEGEDLP